jgi:hypothetical protein
LEVFGHSVPLPMRSAMPLNAGLSDDLGALMARVPAKSALPRRPYAKTSAPSFA